MSHGQEPPGAGSNSAEPPRYSLDVQSALVSDGFAAPVPDLPPEDAPPPYGEMHDQLQFSQSGFEAGANVTDDGRVNININQKNSRLSELLGATLRNQAPIVEEQGPSPPAYIPPTLGGAPGQTPPPRLNVVIQIVGSRGDVQPFVALGKVLKATYGHRVRIATHATFQKFVEDNGLEFFSIGGDPSELMAFMVKNPGLMPGFDALKTGEVSKRRRGMEEILLGCWRSCIEPGNGLGPRLPPHRKDQHVNLDQEAVLPGNPSERPFIADAIIANPPSFAHIHVAEKLGIPLHLMFTMPWTPTRSFPHPLADIMSSNTDDVMTNYLSYTLVEMMTWQGLGDVINRFREKILELEPLSLFYAPGLLTRLRIPYTYCWSPALIPKPNDWQNNVDISGFFFLDLATSYTPEPELAAFLEAGPPPVYIGFGSIVVDDPNALARLIFDAIHLSGIRAIVSQGWGGLGADDVGIPPGVFMVGNCPHDWLFQRVSCVVHHGGAGTMAAGVRAGKPTVIVPFFGDQPFWGAMIERAGAGPAPLPYKDITAEKLAQAITQALKPQTLEQAQSLGRKIAEERGSDMGGKSFHDHLDLASLRCALVPSRAAVWRVRRTKVCLSAFAAAVLVSLEVLSYSDLKMWRPREYNTDGQPWDPISAVAASLVADISTIAMAVADFPRGMFQGSKKDSKQKDSKSSKDSESRSASSRRLSDLRSPNRSGSESRTTLQTVSSSSTAQESADLPAGVVELPATEIGTPPVPTERESAVPGSPELPPNVDPALAAGPSLTVTSDESRGPDRVSTIDSLATQKSSDNLSQEPSAGPSQSPHSRTPSHSRAGSHSQTPLNTENPYQNINLDDLRGAGTSVKKIVTTGMKSPMNFCLNLAKGFRNVPRLYNDDTVRPPEKVTDMTSGLKVAGREFGFGIYDGLSGLVTQPYRGAQKEGGVGLVKGFGRGVGGAFMKPFGALVSLPAYSIQGAYLSLRNRFAKSVDNYIAASRVIQGGEEYDAATPEEREAVLAQWNRIKFDLRNFYALKLKEAKDGKEKERSPALFASAEDRALVEAPASHAEIAELLAPHSGDSGTSRLGLRAKDSWKRSHIDVKVPPRNQDEEFEHAIQASVRETSRGDAEEDARVEKAIRRSVRSVRNVHTGRQPASTSDTGVPPVAELAGSTGSTGDVDLQITEEEYQELLEQAIQQSMVADKKAPHPEDDEDLKRVLERSKTDMTVPEEERDEELRRAIEESRAAPAPVDEDEELRKAIEASEREERDRERREKTEEDIVLEYVMKQSLQEEEYRRAMREGVGPLADAKKLEERDEEVEGTGKGKEREVDSDEEELRRAVEMSMKVDEEHDGADAGPSAEVPASGKES